MSKDERSDDERAKLLLRLREGTPTVGVIGLGYVGLPLSLAFVDAGLPVIGFDVDTDKCMVLRKGGSYLSTVAPNRVETALGRKLFHATTDSTELAKCDAIVICVPTPLGDAREPDLKYIRMTAEQIAGELREGQLVVLESTTYPGTTEEIVRDILERSNLVCGTDFWLAFSPEREDPGNPNFTTSAIPKLVGGVDAFGGDLAESLYKRAFAKVVRVSNARVAEAAKLVENIYRAVNIALVNELKIVFEAMNLDIWEVIAAAATKPFGYQPFYPGPGLGGHCIPIDPFYLTWKAAEYGVNTRFIELAGEINSAMPERVLHRIQDTLNHFAKPVKGSKILVLGVAYKSGVSDTRESPGLELLHQLRRLEADVVYHDPLAPHIGPTRKYAFNDHSATLTDDLVRMMDLVVMVTPQPDMDLELVARHARVIVDTRNAFASFPKANVVKA